jgi:hypothetical protein
MKNLSKYLGIVLTCFLATLSCTAIKGFTANTSIVYYGWDVVDTVRLRSDWQTIDTLPFNGVGITVPVDRNAWINGQKSTTNRLHWLLFGKKKFSIDQFSEQIADLNSTHMVNVIDNLMPVILSSSNNAGLNWFDDERIAIAISNINVMAMIMEKTGIKNVLIDPEHYNEYMFSYDHQNAMHPASKAEYAARVRDVGQWFAWTITSRLGPINVLSLFGYTLPASSGGYSLFTPFLDGILDVLYQYPGSTLTDGYEYSYGYKQFNQFWKGSSKIKDACGISANPQVCDTLVKVGFGSWVDYQNNQAYFTPEEFRRAVTYAKLLAKRFVWIYSEHINMTSNNQASAPYLDALSKVP